MSDIYSNSSFECLGDEAVSDGSKSLCTSSLINQYDKLNGSNDDTNGDILSLTNSITSENELWTCYEKESVRQTEDSKAEKILKCLLNSDIKGLKKLGRQKYGFVSDSIRRLVWPKITRNDIIVTFSRPDNDRMETHSMNRLVTVDVHRARFPSSMSAILREQMEEKLKRLIMRVLLKNPEFHYYQGYHEMCLIFLVVLGEEMAFHVACAVSKTHLRPILLEDGVDKMANLVQLTILIVAEEEPKLGEFFEALGHIPLFSLPWVTTWFAYNVKDFSTIVRLFDLFLVSDPMLPVYLSAAMILNKKDEILELECDYAPLHVLFKVMWSKEDEIPFDELICNAQNLLIKYVPEKLTQLQASRTKHRKQRSALNRSLNTIRSSSLKLWSVPVIIVVFAIIYQLYVQFNLAMKR